MRNLSLSFGIENGMMAGKEWNLNGKLGAVQLHIQFLNEVFASLTTLLILILKIMSKERKYDSFHDDEFTSEELNHRDNQRSIFESKSKFLDEVLRIPINSIDFKSRNRNQN